MENLQKAEVHEEKGAEGRIQVIVLGEAGLKVFLQLVVRFLHLASHGHGTNQQMNGFTTHIFIIGPTSTMVPRWSIHEAKRI